MLHKIHQCMLIWHNSEMHAAAALPMPASAAVSRVRNRLAKLLQDAYRQCWSCSDHQPVMQHEHFGTCIGSCPVLARRLQMHDA